MPRFAASILLVHGLMTCCTSLVVLALQSDVFVVDANAMLLHRFASICFCQHDGIFAFLALFLCWHVFGFCEASVEEGIFEMGMAC